MATGRVERNPDSDTEKGESKRDRRLSKGDARREATQRLEEIHQYLADRYARRDVVARTVTPGGLALDWVPIKSQLRRAKLAEPPGEDRPFRSIKGERPIMPVRFELELPDAQRGPEGTVPLVRKEIKRIRPTGTLNDWLAKGTRAHRVAADRQRPRRGAPRGWRDAQVRQHQPVGDLLRNRGQHQRLGPVRTSGRTSSRSGSLACRAEAATGQQTLEVGHQEYRDLYGDWVPHLFLFYTTNGYT